MNVSANMMVTEPDNFNNRIHRALSLPIRSRCAELTVLFDRGSTLDLQNFFPVLIENLFGTQGSLSWGLRAIRDVNEDFRQLEHFLSPCGPVFKLIYTLLKDPSAKYEFPLVLLPRKVQAMLKNTQHTHPFYTDLAHADPKTREVISTLMNPFDYYMFHFAYHLVNPSHQRMGTYLSTIQHQTSWNTVYYVLCCDYMLHFLPSNPVATVLPIIYYNGKNPLHPLQQINRSPLPPSLLSASLLNKSLEEYSFNQTFGRHPRNQIWRSETVLTIFIDMWLNNDQISQPLSPLSNTFNSSNLMPYSGLPTSEYMRILRVMMKQLHAFSACANVDDSDMSELRKIAIPMVQSKFYYFVRQLIRRWPLDGSFRLLLELWLTYIQPWRYPSDMGQLDLKKNIDSEESMGNTSTVGREHLPFIASNLLTYVVIFKELLPKFTRVDLVSPKMAVMVYRISKVFNQPNLSTLIKEVEQSMENNEESPAESPKAHFLPNFSRFHSPRSPTSSLDNSFSNSLFADRRWAAIANQRILELEGPGVGYTPLFSTSPSLQIFELIIQIQRSINVAQELVQIKRQEEKELYGSFFGLFRSLWEPPTASDEFSLNERLKVPEYLEKSLEHLHELFDVPIPELPLPKAHTSDLSLSGSNGAEFSDYRKFLTPIRVRERAKKIKYEGDPDLHPVRSTEIAFFVNLLYQLSFTLNQNFSQKFCEFYYDQSYCGRLSRQFLHPPVTIYRYDKSVIGSPRVSSELPPRVSFRNFASYRFWTYLILGGVGAVLCGYSIPLYLVFIIFIVLIYKCIKAIPSNYVRQNYPTQGFGNISFSDSF